MGSSSASEVVVGYRYYAGIHFVICRSADALIRLDVGDRTAWEGVFANGSLAIDQPNLHGGDEREGGISGVLDVMDGNVNQVLNEYLEDKVGPDQPAYRGVLSAVWRGTNTTVEDPPESGNFVLQRRGGLVSALNPYIKPWRFLVKRTATLDGGAAQWEPALAEIDGDMNPMHIIRECITNTVWGLGIAETLIDNDNFVAAAQTLFDEEFGLSLLWSNGDLTIRAFIENILAHIDAVMYPATDTGRFTIRLIREDYDPETLDIFGEDDIADITGFVRTAPGEVTTQLEVRYMSRETYEPDTVVLHNLAMVDIQGGNIIDNVSYLGITKRELALRVGTRDLRAFTAMLSKGKIVANRRLANKVPGDVFKISWPALNIVEMIVRITDIDYGTMTNGRVTLTFVQDVFGLDEAIYSDSSSGWVSPYNDPVDPPRKTIFEIPLWSVVRLIVPESQVGSIQDGIGYLQPIACRPVQDAINYVRWAQVNGQGFSDTGTGFFFGYGITTAAMDHLTTEIFFNEEQELEFLVPDTMLLIDEEICRVTEVNQVLRRVRLTRGMLDTLPTDHQISSVVWFTEVSPTVWSTERSEGDVVDVKFLTRTTLGILPEGDAIQESYTVRGRPNRPFVPGNLRVFDGTATISWDAQGEFICAAGMLDVDVRWNHRDRLQQTATWVDIDSTMNIGPEAGVTYELRFKTTSGAGIVRRQEVGLTGTGYVWTEADQRADYGLGPTDPLPTEFWVELKAVRGALESLSIWNRRVARV